MSVRKSLPQNSLSFSGAMDYTGKRYSRVKFSRSDASQPCTTPLAEPDMGGAEAVDTGKNAMMKKSKSVAKTNNYLYGTDI